MTRYAGPEGLSEVGLNPDGDLEGKFVRSGEIFSLTPYHTGNSHKRMAIQDGIYDGPYGVRNGNLDDVDAGLIDIYPNHLGGEGGFIAAYYYSTTLGLPLTGEARQRTGEILRRMHPGWIVKVEFPPDRE